ncbi:Retinoblastoma-binding-like protein E [Galdieria sulphuraria]|nr:Retinoblastoma-binding-like protein E [Galdieria sulphuraria]
MNKLLLNPFESQTVPEVMTERISECYGNCLAFNRTGNLLAVGSLYGIVVIVDFDTYGPIVHLRGHEERILSLCWSYNSFSVLSCGKDRTVRLWYLPDQKELLCLQTRASPYHVEFHPKNPEYCIVDMSQQLPLLVRIEGLQGTKLVDELPEAVKIGVFEETEVEELRLKETAEESGRVGTASKNSLEYFCFFIKDGEEIVRFDNAGSIFSFTFKGLQPLRVYSLPGKSLIRQVVMERRRKMFAVITQDRYIRLFDLESLFESFKETVSPVAQFTDIVGRSQWSCACFSGHSEYLLCGTKGSEHKILVWRIEDGQLEKTLEGPKESIVDLAWNPRRNTIVSCGGSGSLYVWTKDYTENWSAFAPEFTELEENEEYFEREDEFDFVDGILKDQADYAEDEEHPVDIISSLIDDLSDSPHDGNEFCMPVVIDELPLQTCYSLILNYLGNVPQDGKYNRRKGS